MPPSTHPFHSQRETAENPLSGSIRFPGAAGCSPRRYSAARYLDGAVAQLGERLLCKQEVIGSIPFSSTRSLSLPGPGVRDRRREDLRCMAARDRMTVYRFACRVLAPDIRACSSVG
jgi:hypothetical protein